MLKTIAMLASLTATAAVAQGQADLGMKAEAARRQADQQLNVTWRKAEAAMASLDVQSGASGNKFPFQAKLLAAQRQWLALRDDQCKIEEEIFEGGSISSMVGAQCATRMTKERIADLQAILSDNKGTAECIWPSKPRADISMYEEATALGLNRP